MKRFILSAATIFTILCMAACGTRKASTGSDHAAAQTSSTSTETASAAQWRSAVKGTWRLNSVNRENLPSSYTVKNLFEEAPAECFIGSIWNLPGNNNGTITFGAEGTLCAPGTTRSIVWSIYNPGKGLGEPQFQFKKVYAGDKAKNVTTGFRLDLSYADSNTMTLRLPVTISSGEAYIVLQFERVNK